MTVVGKIATTPIDGIASVNAGLHQPITSCASWVIEIALALNRQRAGLQRSTQSKNDAHRIVQTFLLIKVIADCIIQFPRTYDERSFCVIDTSRQSIQIRLANRSLVQIFPRFSSQTSANASIHKLTFHNADVWA
jgi:hypothetical protein